MNGFHLITHTNGNKLLVFPQINEQSSLHRTVKVISHCFIHSLLAISLSIESESRNFPLQCRTVLQSLSQKRGSSMFFLLVLFTSTIFAISAATWWLWFKFSYFCKLVNQFPGPLIGNALEILGGGHGIFQFEKKSLVKHGNQISLVLRKKIHEEWATTYGEAFRFFVGSKVYLVVSSPELIEVTSA